MLPTWLTPAHPLLPAAGVPDQLMAAIAAVTTRSGGAGWDVVRARLIEGQCPPPALMQLACQCLP